MENWQDRMWICIGLGGICEGYLPHLLLLQQTKVVRASHILLVDGQAFRPHNRERQHFGVERSKATERCDLWGKIYPDLPLESLDQYVTPKNVAQIVLEGSIVLLSPDNQATRKLVSDHAETLDNLLLLSGENDGIRPEEGRLGFEGSVVVHWRVQGQNRTPPITRYHPEIREPDDRLPSELGCLELAQRGEPQLLATNLLVGHAMAQMVHRYVTLPPEDAVKVVELGMNVREGAMVPYSLEERVL